MQHDIVLRAPLTRRKKLPGEGEKGDKLDRFYISSFRAQMEKLVLRENRAVVG